MSKDTKEEDEKKNFSSSDSNDFIHHNYNSKHTKLLLDYVQLKERKSKIESDLALLYEKIKGLYLEGELKYDSERVDINVTETKARIPWKARFTDEVGEEKIKEIENEERETDVRIWVVRVVKGMRDTPIPPQYRTKVPLKVIK